jgi:hypothetical protein
LSFNSIAKCVEDEAFMARTEAAYAKEGVASPETAWYVNKWAICADPSVEAPYESALAASNPNPGGDESVITDGMLTAAVNAHPYVPESVPPGQV